MRKEMLETMFNLFCDSDEGNTYYEKIFLERINAIEALGNERSNNYIYEVMKEVTTVEKESFINGLRYMYDFMTGRVEP